MLAPPAASVVGSRVKPCLLSLHAPLCRTREQLLWHWARQGYGQACFCPPGSLLIVLSLSAPSMLEQWSRDVISLGGIDRSWERKSMNGRTILLTLAWGEALRTDLTSLHPS